MSNLSVFQTNFLRQTAGFYEPLTKEGKILVKSLYEVKPYMSIKIEGKGLYLEKRINELYLFHSLCISYKNIQDKDMTRSQISLFLLEVVSRVVYNPLLYLTLINYHNKSDDSLDSSMLNEVLSMFSVDPELIYRDDMIVSGPQGLDYKGTTALSPHGVGHVLRGNKDLKYIFNWINYLDLVTYDHMITLKNIFPVNTLS